MAKQPATVSGKTPASRADGHVIQKPRLLDAEHDREITARNDAALVGYQADAGIKEVKSENVTVEKTADVKEKDTKA